MKAVLVLIPLIGLVQCINYSNVLEAEWKTFKLDHGKSYASIELELLRREIFMDNKKLIDRHNQRYEAGEETYTMGVNQFTDLLHEEFVSTMLGSSIVNTTDFGADYIYEPPANLKLPETVDWRTQRAVTGVKNQLNCGCCWAFAAVATLESQHFLKTKKLVELSEQNLLDCSTVAPYRNKGCEGGSPQEALRYVKENRGLNVRSFYGYEGHKGKCRFHKNQIGVAITGSGSVRAGDEGALQAAVANKGPISVTIDAKHLQHYKAGIYNTPCSGEAKYHSILLAGYGKDRGHDYWLLKNSWGNWGEQGYFRMLRNNHNLCYIANWPVYPLI